jgi:hypothetical protein
MAGVSCKLCHMAPCVAVLLEEHDHDTLILLDVRRLLQRGSATVFYCLGLASTQQVAKSRRYEQQSIVALSRMSGQVLGDTYENFAFSLATQNASTKMTFSYGTQCENTQ